MHSWWVAGKTKLNLKATDVYPYCIQETKNVIQEKNVCTINSNKYIERFCENNDGMVKAVSSLS